MRRGLASRLGVAGLVGIALASGLGLSACVRRVRPTTAVIPTSAAATDFTAHALPIYRLVTNEALIDTPSRLLVLQVRLEAASDAGYSFAAQDLVIVLPDGTKARIFDRARAFELLRRTTIAEADFGYLQRPGYVPGGIAPYSRQPLVDMVGSRLLSDGIFDAANPLQGYVIVDTGAARTTLDGATVEVVAHRMTDSAPTRVAYQLVTAPQPATEAP
ncbi:MAG: hypothetical protein ABI629_01715 [bacterium]